MAKVAFSDVTKKFGDFTAVKQANLEIEDGEFMVLVGSSGCGKTTLLRMAAGLEEITEGQMRIGERVVNDVSPKDRDIAMVFQNYALYPHMSVYQNMAFGLKLRKTPKPEIDRRVKEAADLLGLEDRLDHKPRQLSGGQRQRVAVGRAIVRNPQVFLFDEPLSNLDAKLRVQMRAELQRLHRRLATTTIYVTHDQVEAMTLGKRVAVMEHGVLRQVATPQDLYDHPSNKFVAEFIGSPSMNLLEVAVSSDSGKILLSGKGFQLVVPQDRAGAFQALTSRSVLFGIRPEDLKVKEVENCDATIDVKVTVVEPLGDEIVIYGEMGDAEIVAQLPPRIRVEPDQTLRLYLDMDHMHAFDLESEDTIFASSN